MLALAGVTCGGVIGMVGVSGGLWPARCLTILHGLYQLRYSSLTIPLIELLVFISRLLT